MQGKADLALPAARATKPFIALRPFPHRADLLRSSDRCDLAIRDRDRPKPTAAPLWRHHIGADRRLRHLARCTAPPLLFEHSQPKTPLQEEHMTSPRVAPKVSILDFFSQLSRGSTRVTTLGAMVVRGSCHRALACCARTSQRPLGEAWCARLARRPASSRIEPICGSLGQHLKLSPTSSVNPSRSRRGGGRRWNTRHGL